MMRLLSLFVCSSIVAAQESGTVAPTIPQTYEPTTTFPPTGTPTKAPVPAPVPKRACYSDLVEVADLVKLKNPFIVEKYILCPNTVYQMGSLDPISFEIVNGFEPIFTRSNSIYQCGEDGKSSSNCVITGGEYHVFHEYISYRRENKVNVVFQGITFDGAKSGGLILAAPGDISFSDCIFRNHQSTGVFPLLYSYSATRRLKTILAVPEEASQESRVMKYYHEILRDPIAFEKFQDDAARGHKRRLQAGEIIEMQTVTMDGCLFEDNNHGPDSSLTIDGLIYVAAASNDLSITNSIFRNNTFASPINGGNGFAVSSVPGSKLSISDVCFTDNMFVGSGAVVIEGSADGFTSSNVYGTVDPNLICPYASIDNESCMQFESSSCTALHSENNFAPVAASNPGSQSSEAPTTAAIISANGVISSDSVAVKTGTSLTIFILSLVVAW